MQTAVAFPMLASHARPGGIGIKERLFTVKGEEGHPGRDQRTGGGGRGAVLDPCLSCSAHALGRMPMIVELKNRRGETLDRLAR